MFGGGCSACLSGRKELLRSNSVSMQFFNFAFFLFFMILKPLKNFSLAQFKIYSSNFLS